ncbi:hypothetical protein E2C01_094164 [Portunus trituberculatus]|uniref:Endonuclease/exonuclease/phosphatase domain-containing protein n=1 Tax=Portunus trituberculatus TaxID=210409 RepID=A0A5B7JRR8_PORTR|nr:hypothetical protein [Portunus trituberculatus]
MIDNNTLKHLGPAFSTFYSSTTRTTPDIILGNKHIYHNITIKPGPDSPSDHICIIVSITSKAIRIPVPPKYNYHLADWDSFQTSIQDINSAKPPEQATLQQLDKATETWFKTIKEAMETNIPKTNNITINKSITNTTVKSIQRFIANLKIEAETRGWTLAKLHTYNLLKKSPRQRMQ